MDGGTLTSFSIIGLWLSIGTAVYILQRDRRRSKKREAEVEERLAEWVEEERKRGASALEIADGLDEKKLELKNQFESE